MGGLKGHMKSFEFGLFSPEGNTEELQRDKLEEEVIEYKHEDAHKNPMRIERISEMIDVMQSMLNYINDYVPEYLLEEVQQLHTAKLQDRGFDIKGKVRVEFDE